jgi:hypothetical protein
VATPRTASGAARATSTGATNRRRPGEKPAPLFGVADGYSESRGALAQLGERRLCKPEVTGSIPVRSTFRKAVRSRTPPFLGHERLSHGCGRPRRATVWSRYPLFVQLLGDLLERHPFLEHPSNPHTPKIVLSVAEHVREPDVPGVEASTVRLELGIVVRRRRPSGQGMGSRIEMPSPLVAITRWHLAAEFDDLPAFRHLNEDAACSKRSELLCDRVCHRRVITRARAGGQFAAGSR